MQNEIDKDKFREEEVMFDKYANAEEIYGEF